MYVDTILRYHQSNIFFEVHILLSLHIFSRPYPFSIYQFTLKTNLFLCKYKKPGWIMVIYKQKLPKGNVIYLKFVITVHIHLIIPSSKPSFFLSSL